MVVATTAMTRTALFAATDSIVHRFRPRSGGRDFEGFALINRTGYDTGDLRRFLARGFHAMGFTPAQVRTFRVVLTSAPQRSRGCAHIDGRHKVLSLALASPHRASLRRLARLFEHESAHLRGIDHEQMDRRTLYSLGNIPAWAEGTKIRYWHRAPNQVRILGRDLSST